MSAYVPASSSYDDAAERAPRLTPAVLWLLALTVGVYFLQLTVQGDLPRGWGSTPTCGCGGRGRR
jgi:hypothetical protein